MVKYLPANVGDTGSIPGLERSHMLWRNWVCAPQTHRLPKPVALDPVLHKEHSHWDEKPMDCNEDQNEQIKNNIKKISQGNHGIINDKKWDNVQHFQISEESN